MSTWTETAHRALESVLPQWLDLAQPEERRRARLLVAFPLLFVAFAPLFVGLYLVQGQLLLAGVVLVASVGLLVTPAVLRVSRSVWVAGNWVVVPVVGGLTAMTALTGGVHSAPVGWFAAVPLMAVVSVGRRAALAWAVVVCGLLCVLSVADLAGVPLPDDTPEALRGALVGIVVAALSVLLLGLGWVVDGAKDRMRGELERSNWAMYLARERAETARGDLRLILDHMGQSFLTMWPDGTMGMEYSSAVTRWFEAPAPHQSFATWLGEADPETAEWFELAWEQLEDDVLPFDVVVAQLPARVTTPTRSFRVEWRPIVDDRGSLQRMIVVLTDITDELARHRVEEKQRLIVSALRAIASDRTAFGRMMDEAGDLVRVLASRQVGPHTVRALHTLKGNFGSFELLGLARRCHDLEDRIAVGDGLPEAECAALELAFEELVGVLAPVLGRSGIELSVSVYEAFLARLSGGASVADLEREVRGWRRTSVGAALAGAGARAARLAAQLGRQEPEIVVDADPGLRVDSARWSAFWGVLPHVLCNAVDHGLEPADERVASGKSPAGRLELAATFGPSGFEIHIADDGRGIDWDGVRARAERAGLPSASRGDLVQALLQPSFTTREEASLTSGRGIGLSAVASVVGDLGGTIDVTSSPGSGTRWRLRFAAGEVEPDRAVQGGQVELTVGAESA